LSTNTLGKYQILREIARSNDIIYEALDPTLNRRVALKELAIPPNLSPNEAEDRRRRFRREAEAAGRLSHPNIVAIFDYGTDRDRCYIAMEYLEGQTLRDVIKLRGALPVDEATRVALALLDALDYAHRHGVVHRDIKPDNVQILPGGHIKLTDFGIARLMDEPSITADGQVFGTPSYMSPEQVAGKPIDQRSDIFSMGVLLYEMLTGRKPFSGDSVVTITYNIMNREPTPPPGVPEYLSAIIRKAMAKDPAQRYQTAGEMAEDLRNRTGPIGASDTLSHAVPPSGGPTAIGQPPTGPNYPPSGQPQAGPPAPTMAPDPFLKAPAPPAPSPPREPILSPEARNFLGILFVVVGLTGMLLFAIWAVGKAYQSYSDRVRQDRAQAYYRQGMKLFGSGDLRGAAAQFQNAVHAAPKSDIAEVAREAIVGCYVRIGRKALEENDSGTALWAANQALAVKKESGAAHALAAQAYERMGMVEKSATERQAASSVSGGGPTLEPVTPEGKAAREEIANRYYAQAEDLWNRGQQEQAQKLWWHIITEMPGTEAALKAQRQVDATQGFQTPE